MVERPMTLFLRGWPKKFFPVFWRPTAIRVDVVYLLEVAMLVVIVAGWFQGFIVLGCFSLLFKLAEMQNLRLAEFGEVFIKLWNNLRLFPDPMIVQRSGTQSFNGLSDNLVIENL
jgi:hypothetical protein